ASRLLLGPHDDCLDHLALLHRATRVGVLDRPHDHVADAGVATGGPTEHADAQQLAGAGVVRHLEPGLLLDHRARSTTSTTRHLFCLDRGRVSMMRTVSPSLASLASSWACNL